MCIELNPEYTILDALIVTQLVKEIRCDACDNLKCVFDRNDYTELIRPSLLQHIFFCPSNMLLLLTHV
jgi:Uncharacterized protein conserved in bacteria